jgi:hypothetical protein
MAATFEVDAGAAGSAESNVEGTGVIGAPGMGRMTLSAVVEPWFVSFAL